MDCRTIMPARKVPHILKLSVKEQKEFFNSFDVVMCDCDGVMWMIASPLPRTGEAVNALKAAGKQVLFVTNNSMRSDDDYVHKFVGIGVKDFQKVSHTLFRLLVCDIVSYYNANFKHVPWVKK